MELLYILTDLFYKNAGPDHRRMLAFRLKDRDELRRIDAGYYKEYDKIHSREEG